MSTHAVKSDIAVTNAIGTTEAIPFGCSYGHLQVPNGETVTSITVWGSADGETYEQIVIDAAVYTITVAADNFYCLKPEIYGIPYLKFVGNVASSSLMFVTVSQ